MQQLRRWKSGARVVALILVVVSCLLPLIWTLLAAFGLEPEGKGFKGKLTLEYFGEVGTFDPAFTGGFIYTLFVTLLGTFITLVCALPAAYRLAQLHSRWVNGVIMPFLLVLAVIPVISYGLPLADLSRRIGFYGNFVGLVLAYAAVQLPLAVWILRGYLIRLPQSLEEAARLEGANWVTVLWRVVLPAVAAGVVATGVVVFVLNWNLFLLPSLLTESSPQVLPVVMRDFFAFERELEWPTAAAALITSLAPAFILVLVGQRSLDKFTLVPSEIPA